MPFIHPENPGVWTITLASLYHHFCKLYVKRYWREQRILKRIQKLQEEKASKIDKSQADQGGDGRDDDDTLSGEEDEEQVEQQQTSLEDEIEKSSHFLDDFCHERFIEIMSFVIKNLLLSRENPVIDFAAIICRV